MNNPLVVQIDDTILKEISETDTLIRLNNDGRLALKKLLYEKMTPNEYRDKGFSTGQIQFFNFLSTVL